MTTAQLMRCGAAFAVAGLLAACGTSAPVQVSSSLPPATSVAQADERLAAVAAERAAIEGLYAQREAVCYEKFFVNNCLDEAKESRRVALAAQRAIEVDAEYFKRKHQVEVRDREIAAAEAAFREEEARAAAAPPAAPKTVTPVPPPRASAAAARKARRDERVAREAAQEPAKAAQRAANVAAFEERKRKAEARQRQVEQRKAEREAKRAAAEAAKKSEAPAR